MVHQVLQMVVHLLALATVVECLKMVGMSVSCDSHSLWVAIMGHVDPLAFMWAVLRITGVCTVSNNSLCAGSNIGDMDVHIVMS